MMPNTPLFPAFTTLQLARFEETVEDLPERSKKFLLHLIASSQASADRSLIGSSEDGVIRRHPSIPIPCDFISSHFLEGLPARSATEQAWSPLMERGLIEREHNNVGRHLARRFSVTPKLHECLSLQLTPREVTEPRVNSRSGGKVRGPLTQTKLTGRQDNGRLRDPLYAAMRVHRDGIHLFNADAFHEAARDFKQEHRQAEAMEQPANSARSMVPWVHYDMHIESFLRRINERRPRQWKESPDILAYNPRYEVQWISGRITDKSGQQGLMRRLKAAALSGIDDLHNYDIKASQLHGLLDVLGSLGLETESVAAMLSLDRDATASALGISSDTLKVGIYATVFGARIPAYKKWYTQMRKCPLLDALARDPLWSQTHIADLREPYRQARGYLMSLYDTVARVQKRLHADACAADSANAQLRNACGLPFRPSTFSGKSDHDVRKSLMAWKLQGLEASYIHHLTKMSKHYGYRVIGNEHDGSITLGEIPGEAQWLARQRSGFCSAQLVEKAIWKP